MRLSFFLFLPFLLSARLAVGFDIFMGSGEQKIDRYKDYGYNVTPLGDVGKLVTYDEIAPGAIPADSPLRQQIEKNRRAYTRSCDEATKAGLAICIGTDEVTIPRAVFERFHKDIARADQPDAIDLDSEQFWQIYRAKYREVLHAFPAVTYVMIRTGENYASRTTDFVGHTVRDHTLDDRYYHDMARLINETRKVVVDECGRQLIWRTWDLGNDGFHSSPEVYDRVLAGVTERRGLLFAVKYVQTDFWRYNDFNPTIGRGHVDQIVEFQCAREYEGKGAFPNYLGVDFANAMKRLRDLGTKGIWIWDFGGGSGGPHLQNDRWVRANIDAVVQLARHPDLDPRAVATRWAVREFGARAAPKIADLLLLSDDCVRKMVYIEAFAQKHRGWMPSRGLMRDDIIRGERKMALHGDLPFLYEDSKDSFDAVLQEKTDALALAIRLLGIYDSARDDIIAERGEGTYQEARSSLVYLQSLTEVMCHYIRGMFLFYRSQETHDPMLATKAREELQQWQTVWTRYNTEIPKLPGAPSLYRSQYGPEPESATGAMTDTCEKALHTLTAH